MRDYCPVKGRYTLPKTVWNRAVWLIRDRERLSDEAESIAGLQGHPMDFAKPSGISNPTLMAVQKREKYLDQVEVIDSSLEVVPPEYRKGVMGSICNRDPYPIDASRETYSRWKSRFIYTVAVKMGYI